MCLRPQLGRLEVVMKKIEHARECVKQGDCFGLNCCACFAYKEMHKKGLRYCNEVYLSDESYPSDQSENPSFTAWFRARIAKWERKHAPKAECTPIVEPAPEWDTLHAEDIGPNGVLCWVINITGILDHCYDYHLAVRKIGRYEKGFYRDECGDGYIHVKPLTRAETEAMIWKGGKA